MTKDELQKEAYEWTEKNISIGISMYNPSIEMYCGKAYKDGAEPREKQIQIDAKQIRALQKDKGELTEQNTSLLTSVENLNKSVQELEAQIEKMKNWCNCKNYQQCLIELAEQGKGMKPSECCVNCKKWEIREK